MTGDDHLSAAVHRWRQRAPKPALKPDPTNAFELAISERLQVIERDVERLRTQLWWLMTVIVGFALVNVAIALLKG